MLLESLTGSPSTLCHKQINRFNVTFVKQDLEGEVHPTYRARLDDWRLMGLGRPSKDIADAILTCKLNELNKVLENETFIDKYYANPCTNLDGIKPTTLSNQEYNKKKLNADVLNSGMQVLVIQIIKRAEDHNRKKLADVVNAAVIWNNHMNAVDQGVGCVLLT